MRYASSAYHAMSEQLMLENFVVDEELKLNYSNIYLELEDLITKPTNRFLGFAFGLVEQTIRNDLTRGFGGYWWR